MSIITVELLSKQFPREPRPAVDGVSFSVEEGSFVALIGPSGCGKTTLLKMINRLYEPTSGRILVDGMDATAVSATVLRRRIGYVIQQTGLFPHMRIEQNIAVVPELLGWDRKRIDARIDELLDLVALPREYRRRYPRQLSGGQQQRVGLARALAADPAIMLMDEPFGAIDAITRLRLQDELLEIQRRLHKTILFVTHDMEEALRMADKIIVMHGGTIAQYDTPLNIVSKPRNDFVRQLVGGSDVLRRLSLLSVETLLTGQTKLSGLARSGHTTDMPIYEPGGATILPTDSLRTALATLLNSTREALTVVDDQGNVLGRLTFDDIRASIGHTAALDA
jgi:osmoprotectant transport system ATP-binding protein